MDRETPPILTDGLGPSIGWAQSKRGGTGVSEMRRECQTLQYLETGQKKSTKANL